MILHCAGEFDGSDQWLRADLKVDCNADDRGAWLAYATVMVFLYPVGVPTLFFYLLFVKFRTTLQEQRDNELLAAASNRVLELNQKSDGTERRLNAAIKKASSGAPDDGAGEHAHAGTCSAGDLRAGRLLTRRVRPPVSGVQGGSYFLHPTSCVPTSYFLHPPVSGVH